MRNQVEIGLVEEKADREAETAFTVYIYGKKIFGGMQVKEGKPLQMWQLCAYKQTDLSRLYQKDQFVEEILSEFKSGSTKKHALYAYSHLIRANLAHLGQGKPTNSSSPSNSQSRGTSLMWRWTWQRRRRWRGMLKSQSSIAIIQVDRPERPPHQRCIWGEFHKRFV